MAKRFIVNGIEVIAEPMANGMWAGVPVDLPAAILKVMTGEINLAEFLNPANITITEVPETEECDCEVEQPARTSRTEKTLRQYRKDEGLSKTQMAEILGVSRRSVGRYEDAGRLASEFGLR